MKLRIVSAIAVVCAVAGIALSCTPVLLFFVSGTHVDIPDFDIVTGAESTIHVPRSFTIGDVNVAFDIQHPDDSELAAWLESPHGTIVHLIFNESGQNFIGTVIDDEATDPIDSGTAPYTGRFQIDSNLAADSLSNFDGEEAEGTWTLHVTDDKAGNTGSITGWSLSFVSE